MGRSRFPFGESPFLHFLTSTVVGWLPVFTRHETIQILFDSWKFLQDQERLTLLGYVVLENHIHFIASGRLRDVKLCFWFSMAVVLGCGVTLEISG